MCTSFADIDLSDVENNSLISKANSVDIKKVFSLYKINTTDYSKKIICPFPFHANGSERTPSFYYYTETNTFFCFGCKSSGKPTKFVSLMDGISISQAADKIIKRFQLLDQTLLEDIKAKSFNDKCELYIGFSNYINPYIKNNSTREFAEKLCKVFDTITMKKNLNEKAVIHLINKLKNQMEMFEIQCQ